jgi:psiF repeat
MTQQDKMKKCNGDASAKSLKGDERKGFMSECLKADKKL